MDHNLSVFFEHMVPFLRGRLCAAELEAFLGASVSGSRNVAFYRTLVFRKIELLLRELYPATAACIERVRPGHWKSWVERYERAYPCRHYEPNACGRHFPAFLAELASSRTEEAPAYLEELADYEWVRYAVGVDVPVDQAPDSASPAYVVRHYAHDVPRFRRRFFRGQAVIEPEALPVAVIVHRNPETQLARTYYVDLAGLVALARRSDCPPTLPEHQRPAEVEVERAERKLVAQGVIAPRSVA